MFTDEAMLLGHKNVPVGEGLLYFTGMFVYRERRDGYERYDGTLPFGLDNANDRRSLQRVLGAPSWHRDRADGQIASERWDLDDGRRIHATYSSEERLSVLSLSRPDRRE